MIFDTAGNLYGTTPKTDGGNVFEMTPTANGGWAEKVLHNFDYNGIGPEASVIFDTIGNIYGTTVEGGTHNHGTVFELTPRVGGGWREKVLHNFGQY